MKLHRRRRTKWRRDTRAARQYPSSDAADSASTGRDTPQVQAIIETRERIFEELHELKHREFEVPDGTRVIAGVQREVVRPGSTGSPPGPPLALALNEFRHHLPAIWHGRRRTANAC
jgi:hypothetical protein